MPSLLRRHLVFRVILNGVVLLVVSAAGFLGLASVLLGDGARQAERAMSTWFAKGACEAYARAPNAAALEAYPVSVALYSSLGQRLAASM